MKTLLKVSSHVQKLLAGDSIFFVSRPSTQREIKMASSTSTVPDPSDSEPIYQKIVKSSSALDESSLFRSWLQNRLREYFIKSDKYALRGKCQKFEAKISVDERDVGFHSLKVVGVEDVVNEKDQNNVPNPTQKCILKGVPTTSDDALYTSADRRLIVTLKRKVGSYSAEQTQSLRLIMHVGEVHDVQILEAIAHPFVAHCEETAISVHSIVFQEIMNWVGSVKKLTPGCSYIGVPTCYFGRYDSHQKVDLDKILLETNDHEIMSKVNAGMVIAEKTDLSHQSYRLLITEDVEGKQFSRKNGPELPFLSVMNVSTGLEEIAKIHAASWAYVKANGKDVKLEWHFLEEQRKTYIPYIVSLLKEGFPTLTELCTDFLENHKAEDAKEVMKRLHELENKIFPVLKKLDPSSPARGPQTILHLGLNSETVLFRYNGTPNENDNAEEISSTTIHDSESGNSSSAPPRFLIQREAKITNWKSVGYGSPLVDVAFFILFSLPAKLRESATPALLSTYYEAFEATLSDLGMKRQMNWKWRDLEDEYNKGLLLGCLTIATNVTPDSVIKEDDMEVFVQGIRDTMPITFEDGEVSEDFPSVPSFLQSQCIIS